MADDEIRAYQSATLKALINGGILPDEAVAIVCSEEGLQGWLRNLERDDERDDD